MHFNENFGRAQATTKSGAERIKITFPKQKQGEFTLKIVPVPQTYCKQLNHICTYVHYVLYYSSLHMAYADELMVKAVELCLDDSDKPALPTAPSPLASRYTHPDKDTIPLFSRYKH